MEENMSEELLDLAKKIGINLKHKMIEQFLMYKNLLKEKDLYMPCVYRIMFLIIKRICCI